MLLVKTETGEVGIIKSCSLCGGEGLLVKCLSGDPDHGTYKDSFEKAEGHNHTIEKCKMCDATGLIFVVMKDIKVFDKNANYAEQIEPIPPQD